MEIKPDGDQTAVQLADELLLWLSEKTSDLEYRHSNKSYIAGALLWGALDHFNAICLLLKNGAHPSAFALLRVEWQSLINGLWIYLVCPEQDAPLYWTGEREIAGLQRAVKAVEANLPDGARGGKALTSLQVQFGTTMHGFTHMGSFQMQGLTQVAGEVGSHTFPQEQVDAMLSVAVRIALYSATAMAWLRDDEALEAEIEAQFHSFFRRLKRMGSLTIPDVSPTSTSSE